MNREEMLAYRKKLFSDVTRWKIPDRVPLCPFVETWVFHYAGINIPDAFLKDNELLFKALKKYTDDVPVDAIASISNTVPFKMSERLGGGLYTVNEDGVQIIGSGGRIMKDGELPELAKDVKTFFANTLAPRKFPIFNQSLEKNVDLIKAAIKDMAEWAAYNGEVFARIQNELSVPVIIKATNYMPMDALLDYMRDFVGISTDVRRAPDEIMAASESLLDFVMQMYLDSNLPEDDRWLFSPLHYPTYMRPKDFEKLYFPMMKKYIEEFGVKAGRTLHFFMENDWTPYLDILQDLPEGAKVIGLFEIGHAKEIKEKLKGRMIYQGGLAANDLKFRKKEEIADVVKKTFDELAPGGGFIYGTEYSMMNLNDGIPENFIEAMTVAQEYGKY